LAESKRSLYCSREIMPGCRALMPAAQIKALGWCDTLSNHCCRDLSRCGKSGCWQSRQPATDSGIPAVDLERVPRLSGHARSIQGQVFVPNWWLVGVEADGIEEWRNIIA